jgi:hypothetical protein
MPKVFGMHEIELQPGVEPEEYEGVFAEEIASSFTLPGWKTHLLKVNEAHATASISCSWKSRVWRHRVGTSRDSARSRRSSLRFLEQHTEAAAALEKWQKMGPSDRKQTFDRLRRRR